MGIPRLGPDATPDEIAAALLDRGCVIVERLAPPELCDRVETELAPWSARTPVGGDEFTGRNTRRTGALLARVPSSVELIAHPRVLEVCDRVLGRKGARYQLHLTQAIAIGPGSPAQQLHRDHWCFDFHRFPVDLDVEVSTIWALCDFDEANGATRVIPDTHRVEGLEYDHADSLPAEMPRGSVVLYLGAMAFLALHLYHGAWASMRTLGIAPTSTQPLRRRIPLVLAIVVAGGFSLVPLGVALGIIK